MLVNDAPETLRDEDTDEGLDEATEEAKDGWRWLPVALIDLCMTGGGGFRCGSPARSVRVFRFRPAGGGISPFRALIVEPVISVIDGLTGEV